MGSKYVPLSSDVNDDETLHENNAFNYAEARSKKMKKICVGVFALLFAIAALVAVVAFIVSPKTNDSTKTLTLITTSSLSTMSSLESTSTDTSATLPFTSSSSTSGGSAPSSTATATDSPSSSSTSSSTATPTPTAPGFNYTRPDPSQFRLPSFVVPTAYRLDLQPDLDSFALYGIVEIDVNVTVVTDEILLHALQINVTSAKLLPFGESASNITYYPGKDGELGFVLFRFPSLGKSTRAKEREQFTLRIQYQGMLADDMVYIRQANKRL